MRSELIALVCVLSNVNVCTHKVVRATPARDSPPSHSSEQSLDVSAIDAADDGSTSRAAALFTNDQNFPTLRGARHPLIQTICTSGQRMERIEVQLLADTSSLEESWLVSHRGATRIWQLPAPAETFQICSTVDRMHSDYMMIFALERGQERTDSTLFGNTSSGRMFAFEHRSASGLLDGRDVWAHVAIVQNDERTMFVGTRCAEEVKFIRVEWRTATDRECRRSGL